MIFFMFCIQKLRKAQSVFFLPTNVENGQTEYNSYVCQLTKVQYL